MFEYFIAKRYLRSKHKVNLITIISIISTLGIMIGVAALIVVISVFNGFGSLVTKTLVNVDPHIKISVTNTEDIERIEKELKKYKEIYDFYKVLEGKVIIFNKGNYEVINVKGIPLENSYSSGIQKLIRRGSLNKTSENEIPQISLSFGVSYMLSVQPEDTLFISPINELEKAVTSYSIPSSSMFIFTGLFETNNKDYDMKYAFIDYQEAEKIFNYKSSYSAIEIKLFDIDDSEYLKDELLKKFNNSGIKIENWYDLHRDLYSMMAIERWGAYIILCLIIAVATFNILGSLTMSVIEKRKDIGLLKTMGATNHSIMKLFTYEGFLIGIIGTLSGVFIGLAVCFCQIYFKFYPLDPSKYIIDALPVEVRLFDVLLIFITAVILSLSAAYYPAKKATSTSIVESIKWE